MSFDRATKLEGLNEQKGNILLVENEIIAYIPGKGAIAITLDATNMMALLKHVIYQSDEMLRHYMDGIEREIAKLTKKLDKRIEQAQSGVFDYQWEAEEDINIIRQDIKIINKQLDELYRCLEWIGNLYDLIIRAEIHIDKAWEAVERVQYKV